MATSYSNLGGQGVRFWITASTTLSVSGLSSVLLNGLIDNVFLFNTQACSGLVLRFDFGTGQSVVIDEVTWFQSNTSAEGTWQWQGSNDGVTWTNIGSSFALGGATTQVITALSGNVTGWRFYQILGVSGSTSSSPFLQEIQFKISGANSPWAETKAALVINDAGRLANHQPLFPATPNFLPSHYNPVPVAANLAGGITGTAYSESIVAQGGTSPYTFAVTSGALPTGTTLNTSSGVISGTTSAASTFAFTITVTDSLGFTGSQAFQIIIAAPSGGSGYAATFLA